MNEPIAGAILDKRRLRFRYNGQVRVGEPQCYGVGAGGRYADMWALQQSAEGERFAEVIGM